MNKRMISIMLGVLALAALVGGAVLLSQAQGALPGPRVSPLRTPVAETPLATPVIIRADQTPTPWLTPTPLPQPTRRPGPTETPLPLVQPAQDAAGEIMYVDVISSREEARGFGGVILGKTLAVSALTIDEAGVAQRTAAQLTGAVEPNFEWTRVYPSPDGQRLAMEGDWAFAILNTETGRFEPLALPEGGSDDRFFGWHPDSRRVLYRQSGGYNRGLVLVGTEQYTLLVNEAWPTDIRDAAASPDGQKVVYSFWNGFGPAELRMINIDGSDPRVLLTCGSDMGMLSWSPDGGKIGFLGCDGYTIVNPEGDMLRTLALNLSETPAEPAWSPDGRLLVYASTTREKLDPYDPFRQTVVHIVDVTTGEEILTLPEATDPAWSPDGSQIAFVSARSGAPEIWAISVDGTNLRQLTQNAGYVRFPFWRRARQP